MTKNLTEGNPAKLIFFFTMPLIAGNIFQQLYAFVDTLLVGRFLGVDALAAVGCTGSLMFFMIGFVIGLTTGFSIYTGQRFGANDEEGVRRSAAACVVLSIVSAIILTVFGTLLCRTFLIWMQTPAEILDDATKFISIVYGGVSITVMFNMLSNLIRALGDSRTPLYFMILATVINIILEVLFILVFEWGVSGAAAATVTAQLISNLFCMLYIVKKLPILHIRREDWHLSKKFLWEHLKVGLPMGFQASIIAIGAIVLQIALNNLGPVAVAAYAAAQKVDAVAVMPMMSFGMAMAAYTAQNYGAKKIDRIEKGVNQCILMSGTFSILVGLFNIFCGPYIMHMFVGDGQQQVIDYGQMYLTVNGVNYFVLSLLFVYRYTLQGLGQSMVPTIAGIVELLMRAGAAIVLVNYFGYIGACFANPMAWIGSCLPLAVAYYMTRRGLRKSYAKVYSKA
ncbi:MAG: MATE family efflux transporter [Selenomonadaceae bacterium]